MSEELRPLRYFCFTYELTYRKKKQLGNAFVYGYKLPSFGTVCRLAILQLIEDDRGLKSIAIISHQELSREDYHHARQCREIILPKEVPFLHKIWNWVKGKFTPQPKPIPPNKTGPQEYKHYP